MPKAVEFPQIVLKVYIKPDIFTCQPSMQEKISGSNFLVSPSNLPQKCSSGAANCWFKCVDRSFFVSENIFHALLDCSLFEINISYGFEDIKAIN